MSSRPTFKIQKNEKYIPTQILENIIESTNVSKAFLEEDYSELWYESKNGKGKTVFRNNITYEGFLKFGILNNENPEEPCKINFPDGTIYIGTVINNELTGEGKYIFDDGSTYEGSILNGLRHGKGTFKSNDGIYYEGEWLNGLKHGKGKTIIGNMELEGEYINDVLNGKCRIKWKTGNLFDGKLQNNKMIGNGYMVWKNKNEKYTGMWKDNLQDGFGIHIWYDSKNDNKYLRDRYIGEWKEGKRNGYGKFYYSNGNIYEGYWKNNNKEGFGILYYNDRTKFIGTFKNDNIFEVNNEKKKKEDLKKSKVVKDNKKNRINQNIDEIKLNISIKDIINSEESDMKSLKNIDNLILRNLSLITHLYLYACGKEEIKAMDIGISTLGSPSINDSKNFRVSRRNTKLSNENSNIMLKQSDSQTIQPEKKIEKVIDYDNVYNNDLYFCLDLNHFWKLIRECGLITQEVSLAMINRICFQNPDNKIEMFYIPEILNNNSQSISNEEEKDIIYNYIFNKIRKEKLDFETKYKALIKKSKDLIYGSAEVENKNKEKENHNDNQIEFYDDFDIHEGKNIILLRYFYEIIIRLAYIRYINSDMTLFSKTKKLLEDMKSFLKYKMKSGNFDNPFIDAVLMTDPKLKNIDLALSNFISEYNIILNNLFKELYECSCDNEKIYNQNDMTITYRYFYDNIINNSEPLSKVFENKLEYIDIISLYIKEKKVNSYNYSNAIKLYDESEIMEYIDNLLDYEMIFIEFCELVFFISRKYFIFYGINKDDEMNTINTNNNKSQSVKRRKTRPHISSKRTITIESDGEKEINENKEIKETKESKDIENYKIIINYIIIEKDKLIKQDKYSGKNKYYFPYLKTHQMIYKHIEDEKQRKLEEERKEKERIRFTNERNLIKEEDINVYIEEEEKENSSETFNEDNIL